MLVKWMDVEIYEDRWKHSTMRIDKPAWDDIEAAIRNLDKFHHPFIILGLYEDLNEALEHGLIEVIGGEGVYWLAITEDGFFQRRLLDKSKSSRMVEVWKSDQGFADETRHMCYGTENILRIVKLYAEQAKFDPTVGWDSGWTPPQTINQA